jgi:CRISPR/Cas system Type II protein with McrA/HNH and RuvC-like nuclease domain
MSSNIIDKSELFSSKKLSNEFARSILTNTTKMETKILTKVVKEFCHHVATYQIIKPKLQQDGNLEHKKEIMVCNKHQVLDTAKTQCVSFNLDLKNSEIRIIIDKYEHYALTLNGNPGISNLIPYLKEENMANSQKLNY